MTAAARHVRERIGAPPQLAMVLGSGLGALVDEVEAELSVPYAELPDYPVGKVAGHAGKLVVGTFRGTRVAILAGRPHLYEGFAPGDLAVPIQTVHALGCEALVLTNAAGSIRTEYVPGSLMALTDHINFMGANPLTGSDFIGMGDAYDAELLQRLRDAAATVDVALGEGVYLAVRGPSFETPAEIRAFRTLGADAVGMSTVPEVITARSVGMRVCAVSAITNLAEGLGTEPLSHDQTLSAAAGAAVDLTRVLAVFAENFTTS